MINARQKDLRIIKQRIPLCFKRIEILEKNCKKRAKW